MRRHLAAALAAVLLLAGSALGQQPERAHVSRADFERMLQVAPPRAKQCEGCPWLAAGTVLWASGSAYDIHHNGAGIEGGTQAEGNSLLRREDGSLNRPAAWALTAGVVGLAAAVGWKRPGLRKPIGIVLGVLGVVRFGLGAKAAQGRN